MAKITVQDLANQLKVSVKDITKKLEEDGVFVSGADDTLTKQDCINVISKITGKKVVIKKKETPEEKEAREAKERAEAAAAAKAKAEAEAKAREEARAAARAKMKEEIEAEVKARAAAQNRAREEVMEEVRAEAEAKMEAKLRAEEEARLAAEAKAKAEAEAKAKAEAEAKAKAEAEARAKAEAEAKAKAEAEAKKRTENRDGNRDNRQGQNRDGNRDNRQGQNRDGNRQGQNRDGNRQGQNSQNRDGNRQGQNSQNRDGNRQGQNGQGSRQNGQNNSQGPRQDNRRPGGSSAPAAELPKDSGKANSRKGDWNNKNKDKDNKKSNQNQDDFGRRRNNNFIPAENYDDDLSMHHKKKPTKKPQTAEERAAAKAAEEEVKIVALPETITVKDFADLLHKPMPLIIKTLMSNGIMAAMNQTIEFEQAEAIAMDMGILVEHQQEEDIFAAYTDDSNADEGNLQSRPPVVVVMGHVDHGKTSLLDAIRNSKVTEGEAGGITQHIGASVVEINGRKITFLDTPGHEAFTAMRLRGAMVTDIAVLVVAADDGVMPQTVEAINHAKAAGVSIIVAINKMDKPTANPDRIKQELTEYGLVVEDWGGDVICCPVSAKKREGIDNLLENILLTADILELKADPDVPATGTIIESQLDKGRGAVATVLVQKGTLRVGDVIVSGSTYGRIKAMVDDKGRRVKEAGPSKPVEIMGLIDVPAAGEQLFVTPNEKEARTLAERVAARDRSKMIEGNKKVSLDNLFGDIQAGEMKELNIIVKADVQGSVEAVKQSLEKLSTQEVAVKVIHGAVGAITDSDVMLASASNSVIIGFNVRPDATAKSSAETEKVDIRLYRVIYNAIEDIQAAMKGMLDPEFEEKQLGHAEVRQVFKVSSVGTVAGSYVLDGKITRGSKARLIRDNIVIYEGELASLRRVKDDVKEVAAGYECGIMLERFSDIKEGDIIESFIMEEVKR